MGDFIIHYLHIWSRDNAFPYWYTMEFDFIEYFHLYLFIKRVLDRHLFLMQAFWRNATERWSPVRRSVGNLKYGSNISVGDWTHRGKVVIVRAERSITAARCQFQLSPSRISPLHPLARRAPFLRHLLFSQLWRICTPSCVFLLGRNAPCQRTTTTYSPPNASESRKCTQLRVKSSQSDRKFHGSL